jgi:hypothetical protein
MSKRLDQAVKWLSRAFLFSILATQLSKMLTFGGSPIPDYRRGLTYGLTTYGYYRGGVISHQHFSYVKPWVGGLYNTLFGLTLLLLSALAIVAAWRWVTNRKSQSPV